MKKYIALLLIVLALTGCGKKDMSNIKDDFISNVERRSSFLVKGTMQIISNEDTFTSPVFWLPDNKKSESYYMDGYLPLKGFLLLPDPNPNRP
jgi:uncharacterized protein YcfL